VMMVSLLTPFVIGSKLSARIDPCIMIKQAMKFGQYMRIIASTIILMFNGDNISLTGWRQKKEIRHHTIKLTIHLLIIIRILKLAQVHDVSTRMLIMVNGIKVMLLCLYGPLLTNQFKIFLEQIKAKKVKIHMKVQTSIEPIMILVDQWDK